MAVDVASLPTVGFCRRLEVAAARSDCVRIGSADRGDGVGGRLGVVAATGSAGWPRRGRCRATRRLAPTRRTRAGSTQRATGRWCDVGRRYWPIVTMSTPIAGEVGEQPDDLVVGLAHPDDQPRLRRQPGRLGPRQHRQAAGVAGRRPHGPLQPGDGLDVVVEHVGPRRRTAASSDAASPLASEISVSTRVAGRRARIASTHAATWAMPPSARSSRATIVSTAWSRPMRSTPRRRAPARRPPGASGLRVSTRQKPHARVQRSPSTMNVAVPSAQHSDRFGQPASSHTVTRPRSRTVRLSASTSGPWCTFGPQPLRLAAARSTGPSATPASASRAQAHRSGVTRLARARRRGRTATGRRGGAATRRPGARRAPSPHRSPARRATTSTTSLHRDVDALLGQRRDRPVGDAARRRCARACTSCRSRR